MEEVGMSDATAVDSAELAVVDSVGDLSVVRSADRGPDAIAREIEQTRAELADTIDAIADRISPKKVAVRGAQAMKAQVSGARSAAPADAVDGGAHGPVSHAANQPVRVVPLAAVAGLLVVIVLFVRRRRSH